MRNHFYILESFQIIQQSVPFLSLEVFLELVSFVEDGIDNSALGSSGIIAANHVMVVDCKASTNYVCTFVHSTCTYRYLQ